MSFLFCVGDEREGPSDTRECAGLFPFVLPWLGIGSAGRVAIVVGLSRGLLNLPERED